MTMQAEINKKIKALFNEGAKTIFISDGKSGIKITGIDNEQYGADIGFYRIHTNYNGDFPQIVKYVYREDLPVINAIAECGCGRDFLKRQRGYLGTSKLCPDCRND